jgi:hypothetical protein
VPDLQTLHYGQSRLLNDTTKDEHVVVAGYGYGKTKFGPRWSSKRVTDNKKSVESLVIAPNNRLLKNRCLVEYQAHLASMGMVEGKRGHYRVYQSTGDLRLVFNWGHTVHFLSGETPDNIISYNASHIWIDEPAVMDEAVIQRAVGRLRCPDAEYRQILFTGTPEGTNWFYERFHPDKVARQEGSPFSESETSLILHGSSYDNRFLPASYFRMLEKEFGWDSALFANYVLGEWVSLSRNRFYFKFDDVHHVADCPPNLACGELYLSFDNNVGCLAWAAMQPYQHALLSTTDQGYAVVKANNADAENLHVACEQFARAFHPSFWRHHHVWVYGDAALWDRSNQTHQTGFALIQGLLKPHYPNLVIKAARPPNPSIQLRSICTNKFFGENRLLIDRGCRKVVLSARTTESKDGKVKKPKDDVVTHSMEAVDRVLMAIEPPKVAYRVAA